MSYIFKDYYQNFVQLSFEKEPFSERPKHVWMICQFQGQWLLTEHPTRGIEFPGGKVEDGETAEEAAIREIMEETGGVVTNLEYMAQYCVKGKKDTIIKNVYFAEVSELTDGHHCYETFGPILMKELPINVKEHKKYSFMMKDDVLVHCISHLYKNEKLFQTR